MPFRLAGNAAAHNVLVHCTDSQRRWHVSGSDAQTMADGRTTNDDDGDDDVDVGVHVR